MHNDEKSTQDKKKYRESRVLLEALSSEHPASILNAA